jgi:predicted nucleotide-binding protein
MQLLTKNKALDLLERTIKDGSALPRKYSDTSDLQEWGTWERTAIVRVEAIFGSDSQQMKEFSPLMQKLRTQKNIGYSSVVSDYKANHIDSILAILKSFHSEVADFWNDDVTESSVAADLLENGDDHSFSAQENTRVFIVHGHDHSRMQALARFLERLGLEAIILHEQASQGLTVLEKLESHGNAAFAVILLTPDDVGNTVKDQGNLQPRARQNVVLELGYFIAKLGRRRTCALVVQGVEIPSDYSGVIYITIDDAEAWKFHLARELKAVGLPVDINKAL